MGQAISDTVQAQLKRDGDVSFTTDRHVVLRDGQVIDPSEHLIDFRAVYLVVRREACRCSLFRKIFSTTHQVHRRHAIVRGSVYTFADGSERPSFTPPWCPGSTWIVEEVIARGTEPATS